MHVGLYLFEDLLESFTLERDSLIIVGDLFYLLYLLLLALALCFGYLLLQLLSLGEVLELVIELFGFIISCDYC